MDGIRWELVRRIRREISEGTYVTMEKMEVTAERVLERVAHVCTREGWNGCEACLRDLVGRSTTQSTEDTCHYEEWDNP